MRILNHQNVLFKGASGLNTAKRGKSGVTLLLATLCLPLIIALLGLTVDLGIVYTVKRQLQLACDRSAVAALRSLNLKEEISAQKTTAAEIAQAWFSENFTSNFMGTHDTAPPTLEVKQNAYSSVTVVDVTATTHCPSYFMKYYASGATEIGATSEASRRNDVITLSPAPFRLSEFFR